MDVGRHLLACISLRYPVWLAKGLLCCFIGDVLPCLASLCHDTMCGYPGWLARIVQLAHVMVNRNYYLNW